MNQDELLKRGIAACKAGQRAEARELLYQVLEIDRHNEQAWLWLSSVMDTDAERRTCLEQVLLLNPANAVARRGLAHLQGLEQVQAPAPKPVVTPEPRAMPRTETQAEARVEAAYEPGAAPSPPPAAEPPPAALEKQGAVAMERRERSGMSGWVFAGAALVMVCVAAIIVLTVLGSQGGLGSGSPTDSPGTITSVVYENIAANNAEDIERYMATIHSQAPGRDETREMLAEMYRTFDTHQTLTGVELLESTRTRAEVSFTLTTRKIRGPSFDDNRVTGVFILRTDDGQWKLWGQEVDNIEYLK